MDKVFIGKILKPKGLDGTLKITNFTLGDLAKNFKSVFIDGKCYHVLRAYNSAEFVFFKTEEITTIEEAEAFRNKEVYGLREDLNLSENQFVTDDFIGLDVFVGDKKIGVIEDVQNFGASDIFVIKNNGREVLVPRTNNLVEKVDLEANFVRLNKKEFDEVGV